MRDTLRRWVNKFFSTYARILTAKRGEYIWCQFCGAIGILLAAPVVWDWLPYSDSYRAALIAGVSSSFAIGLHFVRMYLLYRRETLARRTAAVRSDAPAEGNAQFPMFAAWLGYLLLPRTSREAVVGDIEEKYCTAVAKRFSPNYARLIAYRDILGAVVALNWRRVAKLVGWVVVWARLG